MLIQADAHFTIFSFVEIETIRVGNVEFQLHCVFLHGLLNFNQSLTRDKSSKISRTINVGIVVCRTIVELAVFLRMSATKEFQRNRKRLKKKQRK